MPELRDEIYIQLCKQLTGNPSVASAERGWVLMHICLCTFQPSEEFENHLELFLRDRGALPCVWAMHLSLYRGTASGVSPLSAADIQAALDRARAPALPTFVMDAPIDMPSPLGSPDAGLGADDEEADAYAFMHQHQQHAERSGQPSQNGYGVNRPPPPPSTRTLPPSASAGTYLASEPSPGKYAPSTSSLGAAVQAAVGRTSGTSSASPGQRTNVPPASAMNGRGAHRTSDHAATEADIEARLAMISRSLMDS